VSVVHRIGSLDANETRAPWIISRTAVAMDAAATFLAKIVASRLCGMDQRLLAMRISTSRAASALLSFIMIFR
jgi:hypothetical protein